MLLSYRIAKVEHFNNQIFDFQIFKKHQQLKKVAKYKDVIKRLQAANQSLKRVFRNRRGVRRIYYEPGCGNYK